MRMLHATVSNPNWRPPPQPAPAPWADRSESGWNLSVGQEFRQLPAAFVPAMNTRAKLAPSTQNRQLQDDSDETQQFIAQMITDDTTTGLCDDPLATNSGQSAACRYSCDSLQTHYFPGEESRCFVHDLQSGGWPSELLSLRSPRQDSHTFVEAATMDDELGFTIGVGRTCTNITFITSLFMGADGGSGSSSETTRCLVDGEHEHNHTVTTNHSVEVVGYAEVAVHEGAGGTTDFVVGECVDVLIRVSSTSSTGQPVTFNLNDGNHNGPWEFIVPPDTGMHEYVSCMYANDFVLTQGTGGEGWEGSVAVVGFINFHNTIVVPVDEKWILHGQLGPDGVPVTLDARVSSGTPAQFSEASIVIRLVRFSGCTAPLDTLAMLRVGFVTSFFNGETRVGGCFSYDGGGSTADASPALIFDRAVFDGGHAVNGGAIFINGRANTDVTTRRLSFAASPVTYSRCMGDGETTAK